jgi:DNA (cytosine-5)-methyltransferase 1
MPAYYNDSDPFAAQWLRNLIAAGHIAGGDVDERSIVDVRPDDVRGYTQCHFFAGIGGWSYALRIAGWPDDRPVWTGSCPCQPFSLAGKKKGFADERHLWPVWRELIRECSPSIVFGEQVASATDWLRLVRSNLEAMGFAMGAIPFEAASAGADHLRNRFGFVATTNLGDVNTDQPCASKEWQQRGRAFCRSGGYSEARHCGDVAYSVQNRAGAEPSGCFSEEGQTRLGSEQEASRPIVASRVNGEDLEWVIGADGKARRVKSGIRLLAHGIPNRVGLLRGFGNAIDPRSFAQFILAADEAIGAHQ